jgi:putative mRNA 3-end processing factor
VAPTVQIRDGIEILLETGERVVADASSPDGDINILSHAHGDHLYSSPPSKLVCSETTAALAAARRPDTNQPSVISHPKVDLLASGHIAGSRAALIEDESATVLYTGDVSTRDRFYLTGFDPVPADVLIVESTYGKPEYELPPQAEVEAAFVDWLNETMDVPVIAFGYTLGRAQELVLLGEQSVRDRVLVTDAIERINRVIEAEMDVEFTTESYDAATDLEAGDFLVLPSQTNRLGWVESLVDDTDAITVGVSGWAVESSFKFRAGYDETFALSDHCGFGELLDLVAAVDPEIVYTNHGFTTELAQEITSRLGYRTQALQRNQTTLGDF